MSDTETMTEALDLERIAAANRSVDLGQLREVQDMLAALSRGGVETGTSYELASPYDRRAVRCEQQHAR